MIKTMGGKRPVEILIPRDYFLFYEAEEDILQLHPDFMKLGTINSLGFIVTVPGNNSDFVSRFFAPSAGINEDPVTGSAHFNLILYWANRLNRQKLHAYQVSSRRGELWCENKGNRVLMAGKAVTYLKGEIYI